jgi:YD repeat-containing protein
VRKIVLLALIGVAVAAIFAGPLVSGALFLLLPTANAAAPIGVGPDYKPRHKGGIDLATGLYTRENEDLVVPGAPALILRRTYLSRYRVSKEFGIGATHPGEEYLIGDGERFQWASLILATGSRINFRRVSRGTSEGNAMFVHDETPTEWSGARLGWTGIGWALRKRDGSLSFYRGCGPTTQCSIVFARDAAGHTIRYSRNAAGSVKRMSTSGGRWIEFEYDDRIRVIRATASTKEEVRYIYDGRGRLERTVGNDGTLRRYTYTDVDELQTIDEPGTAIQNDYENGRCVRQVNRFADGDTLNFTFTYELEAERVTRTYTTRSDGHWTQFVWGSGGYAIRETRGFGPRSAEFTYDRDPHAKRITSLTITCPDRQGRPLRHSAVVRPGDEERVKANILQTHCHWRDAPLRVAPQ